jgi:hypothetical protein
MYGQMLVLMFVCCPKTWQTDLVNDEVVQRDQAAPNFLADITKIIVDSLHNDFRRISRKNILKDTP